MSFLGSLSIKEVSGGGVEAPTLLADISLGVESHYFILPLDVWACFLIAKGHEDTDY